MRWRTRRCITVTCLLLASALPARPLPAPVNKPAPADWAEQTLRRLSLDEKLGQLLVVYLWGRYTPADSPDWHRLLEWAHRGRIGGIVLQAKATPLGIERAQAYPAAALIERLQRSARIPLLVAADFETGTAMRIAEGTSLPHAMALAATDDPAAAYLAARITAHQARAVGVNWVLGPVADVNNNPDNPIINIRSFGDDPERVARFVTAFVRGLQDGGVLATAKHFPGHGNTSVDSHLGLPVITASLNELERVELVPFRAAMAAGVGSVMTGHLLVPALEPDPRRPATLSAAILQGLLRRQMGFRGLIVTDALDMAGVASLWPPDRVAIMAVAAGADMLLIPPEPEAALAALKRAVQDGELSLEQINAAVRHVLRAKQALGLNHRPHIRLERLPETFATERDQAQALDLAGRGIAVLRDASGAVPLDPTRLQRTLLIAISADADPAPGTGLLRALARELDDVEWIGTDPVFHPPESIQLPTATSYDQVIVAAYVRVADRKGTVGLPAAQAALLERVLHTWPRAIVVSFGSPYWMTHFPEARTWMAAFSTAPVEEEAVARALLGAAPVVGRCPVSVSETVHRGAGLRRAANPMTLQPADLGLRTKLEAAVSALGSSGVPGALQNNTLAVGVGGRLIVRRFLTGDRNGTSKTNSAESAFTAPELAPLFLYALAAQQVERHRLRLDVPVSFYVPRFAPKLSPQQLEQISVAQLLADLFHSASPGPSGTPISGKLSGGSGVNGQAGEQAALRVPASVVAELLAEILERLTGTSLAALAEGAIFRPLGMQHTALHLTGKRSRSDRQALSVSTTAGDLAAFCQMLLNGGLYAHQRILHRSSTEQVLAAASTVGQRGRVFVRLEPRQRLFVILVRGNASPAADSNAEREQLDRFLRVLRTALAP